eukprot:CFRG3024T1
MDQRQQYVSTHLQTLGYKNYRETNDDVNHLLGDYPSLQPRTEMYTTNDGRSRSLLNLFGTLPIEYRGCRYNIPIVVWILNVHPENVPVVYVMPTSSMLVKPGPHVDNDGLVYHPYLSSWVRGSTLSGLMYYLREVFGQSPPVYARPAGQTALRPTVSATVSAMYPPNTSQSIGPPASFTYGQPQTNSYAPPTGYGPPLGPPAAIMTAFRPPAAVQPPDSFATGNQFNTPHSEEKPKVADEVHINEQIVLMSLRSAVEDRLNRAVPTIEKSHADDMNKVLGDSTRLEKGYKDVDSIIKRIDTQKSLIDREVIQCKTEAEKMAETVAAIKSTADTDVDPEKLIRSNCALYCQLLESVAKHNAVEDVVYYLGKGLYKGDALLDESFTLDKYLKYIRQLFREEFHHRATIRKARQEAGLSEVW